MTDDDFPLASHEGPDWQRLAHDIAGGEPGYARALADGTPQGAERAALMSALTSALHLPGPSAPSAEEVEQALAEVLRRRRTIALRVSAIDRAAGRRRHAPWLAAAAVVLVAAGGLLLRQRGETRHGGLGVASVDGPSLVRATAVGQVDSLRLADGTRVVLGPDSRLEVSSRFATGPRDVTLRGEGYFEVVHQAGRPFAVTTPQGVVRDVGTSFLVRAGAGRGLLVAVRSGVVAVRPAADTGAERTLTAGDRGTMSPDGTLRVEHGTSTDGDLQWTHGRLALHDASVEDVADAMRRWYGIDFRVADSALRGRRVTATFDRESGADAARVIAAAMGGTARVDGSTVVVSALPARSPVR